MRPNGLGAPDKVTLVPMTRIEPAQPKTESKPVKNITQNTRKGYRFYCNKVGHFKAECRKMKRDKLQQTRKNNGQTNNNARNTLKCNNCAKPHKTDDCWNGANSANDPRPKRYNQHERKTDNSTQPTTTKTVDESKS